MKKLILLGAFAALAPCSQAALTAGLVAYYNFDETNDNGGLVNQANPGTFDASFIGDTGTGANVSGSGFTGNAAFDGGDGLSNRPVLSSSLGGVLNLADARNNYISTGISSGDVGNELTISLWFALTPGANNNSNRYHLLESGNNFVVSLGTNAVTTTTGPLANYSYLGYVNGQTNPNIQATGVSTESWHHAAMVYSFGDLTLYVDGELIGTHNNGDSINSFTNLVFGRHRTNEGSDRDWDGMIDELAIWNRSLTEDEIIGSGADSLYQRGLAGLAMIPEPSSALLGGLGMLALLGRRRVD